jgi:GDP-L-fucose synthase
MKKILVLGGEGFMGKNIQEVFYESEHEITYRSRRTGTDMTDFISLTNTLSKVNPDIIIHAAAHVGSVGYVSKHSATVVHDNTAMYLTLYEAVNTYNKDIIIINPISNCSYPGIVDVQHEKNWWDGPIHESVESYGTPKKMGFIISQCYAKQFGIKTINLIIPNAYGPNDYINEERTHAMNGIIMRMIKASRNNDKYFVVWGTGSPIREWIYMPDIARLMKKIIDNENYDLPNPLNVGQEVGISIMDSVHTVKDMMGYDVEIKNDKTKQDGAPIKVLGEKLFRTHFPNFKFTSYEEGIINTISYYKKVL